MFEAEIERAKLRLADELMLDGSSAVLHVARVYDHPRIDPAYKEFVRAEVEWLLYHDRIQRSAQLPIDSSDLEFRRLYRQLEDYIRRHARFDRKAAFALIDAAVKSILNFRLRPRVTLKWFVYRGEPTKPVCEILLRMQYFADYPYFRAGFEQWMQERSLSPDSTHIMPVFEFERLIKHIDDEFILDLSTTEFIELLDPIFRFFNEPTTPQPLQSIPIEALIVFLDDKDIQVIAQKFERMLSHEGVRTVTREMILRVVEQVLEELEQQENATSREEVPPAESSGEEVALPQPAEEQPAEELRSAPEESHADEAEQHSAAEVPAGEESAEQQVEETIATAAEELSSDGEGSIGADSDIAAQHAAPLASEEEASSAEAEPPGAVGGEVESAPEQSAAEEVPEETVAALAELHRFATAGAGGSFDADEQVRHSLEREFGLAPSEKPAAEQTPVQSTAVESTEPQGAASAEPATPTLETMLERGLQHVRVQSPPVAPHRALEELIDPELRSTLLAKLCGGREEVYQQLFTAVSSAPTLKAALNQLERFCLEHGIDPAAKAVGELRTVIFKRFVLA